MRDFNLSKYTLLVNEALQTYLPNTNEFPPTIHEAMRYSVLAGGKRLRPSLAIASHEMFGGNAISFLPAAAAIELIHTYSLIHDDLPSMDNDDYRRGKPTNHKVFGEAVAILAGDALLTLAFELMTDKLVDQYSATRVLQSTAELASASGTNGLIGGQVVDVLSESTEVSNKPQTLDYIHAHKTGSLIAASLRIGAILAGATKQELASITRYASYLGLGFQIRDDILDVVGNERDLGKTIGKDQKAKKLTYVSVYGLENAEERAKKCFESCLTALDALGGSEPLRQAADLCINRTK
ncbi:MAG: polyprenyl synthetase family protein [Bacillota bacterium]|nr:polyprenyl synthetase family protein [Bacillota bacterium]